jgi:outer membrane protein TolC
MTRAAAAREKRAATWDAPMLELAIHDVPTSGSYNVDPMTQRIVGLEQRVELFGARGLAKRAAGRDVRAAEATAEDMRWMRFGEAWSAYAAAWFAGQRARAAEEHRGVMNRMAAAARARYESGRGRLDDMLRAEAERARIAGDAATFAGEERAARARLDALRGREPGGAADTLAPPPEKLAPDADAAWGEALAAHPRVKALTEREGARRGSAAAMRRMGWPELRVHAEWAFREPLVDGTTGAHGSVPNDDMWSAGVGIMLPIGNGRRQGAEAAEMTAMADAAAAERRAESLRLAAETAALRARAHAARRVSALLADTVLVAQRRALAAAWSGYEAGSTDLSGVLSAAHASYTEELDVTRARQELAETLAMLLTVTARADLFGLRVPAAPGIGRKP